jgi:hypothetical protein
MNPLFCPVKEIFLQFFRSVGTKKVSENTFVMSSTNKNNIFIDTNVLIGAWSGKKSDRNCLDYLFSLTGKRLFISSFTDKDIEDSLNIESTDMEDNFYFHQNLISKGAKFLTKANIFEIKQILRSLVRLLLLPLTVIVSEGMDLQLLKQNIKANIHTIVGENRKSAKRFNHPFLNR